MHTYIHGEDGKHVTEDKLEMHTYIVTEQCKCVANRKNDLFRRTYIFQDYG